MRMALFSSGLNFPAPNWPMSTHMSAWRNSFQEELQPAAGDGKCLNLIHKSRSPWKARFTHVCWLPAVLITPIWCHQIDCIFLFTHPVSIKSISVLSCLSTGLFGHISDRSVPIVLVFILHLPPDMSEINSSDDNRDSGFYSSWAERGFKRKRLWKWAEGSPDWGLVWRWGKTGFCI